MPIGPFPDFDACVAHMVNEEDHTEEEARRICGAMEAEMNTAPYDGSVSKSAIKTVNLKRIEWKAEQEGAGRAVISTLNVVDKDGDVTLPGAFPDGKTIPISSYGHGSWGVGVDALPIGKGILGSDHDEAWVDFELNLNSTVGREHYQTLKFLGEMVEWSYGYEPMETSFAQDDLNAYGPAAARILKRLEVHEASPVLLGAGVNTRTEHMKSKGLTVEDESEALLASAEAFVTRMKSLADLRAKEGRVLSRVNLARIDSAIEALDGAATALRELRAAQEENGDDGKAALVMAFASAMRARELIAS